MLNDRRVFDIGKKTDVEANVNGALTFAVIGPGLDVTTTSDVSGYGFHATEGIG
jgi:hypothetical protein